MTIAATAIWRVRPVASFASVSNTNGGGFDPGVASPGTNYSIVAGGGPQVTFNGTTITATNAGAGATITITGYAAAATDVGNMVQIASGTNFTAGTYTIVSAVPGVSGVGTWTLDRNCTTGVGAAMVGRMGGAWADPWTNMTSSGPLVPGNVVYIYGGGTDNPSSPDYTKSGGSFVSPTVGNNTAGWIRFIGENGRPRIQSDGLQYHNVSCNGFENIYFSTSSNSNGTLGFMDGAGPVLAINVAFNQTGKDMACITVAAAACFGCEFFSSTANASTAGTNAAIIGGTYGNIYDSCNIHDCWGDGVKITGQMDTVTNSIISGCRGNGITVSGTTINFRGHISHNTIDNNFGHGISVASVGTLGAYDCYSNFITNHTTAAKYGISGPAGTTAVNDAVKALWDFNWFYGNSGGGNYNLVSAGNHDTSGTDPLYTNQGTQDYTLQSSSTAIGKGFPAAANPTLPIGVTPPATSTIQPNFLRRGMTPVVENYQDTGGVQKIMTAIVAFFAFRFLPLFGNF